MESPSTQVLVGNILLNPHVIRRFLKKSHYYASYSKDRETLKFMANHGDGGVMLFEIRNISYESAKKLVEGLGLKNNHRDETPLEWSRWNPIYRLGSDGGEESWSVRMKLLELGLPFNESAVDLGKSYLAGIDRYVIAEWGAEKICKQLEEDAERYKDCLATIP
jgi:hypothetical protein